MKIAVVIVNFNSGNLLGKCLQHLVEQSRSPDAVIIIDNASTDDSLESLPPLDTCHLVRLEKNTGFAAANNLAFERFSGFDYFITLNPDAFPAPDFIEQLAVTAAKHPQYASFACRMMLDENTLDGAGDIYHFSGMAWRDQHGRPYLAAEDEPREVFSACAGAAMYQASALQKVGNFDESFFCYLEDVDLGYRLKLAGEHCLYVPSASVQHLGSAISSSYPGFALYHGHRNLVWTFIKNTPLPLLLLIMPFHLLMTLFTGVIFARRRQLSTYIRAKRDALSGIRRALAQRKNVQGNRRISYSQLLSSYDYSLLPRGKSLKELLSFK